MNEGSEFFILASDNSSTGPYSLEQLRGMWRLGQITRQTRYAEAGYDEWLPLASLHELFENKQHVPANPAPSASQEAEKPDALVGKIASGILLAVAILLIIAAIIAFGYRTWNESEDLKKAKENLARPIY
jgi:hypothetical protein